MKNQLKCFIIISILLICSNASIAQTTFYLKSTGGAALTTLANWGMNTNGTGTAPVNFTTAGQTFVVTNVSTATLTTTWTVSGAGSKVVLGSASNGAIVFTISGAGRLTGSIDIVDPSSGANELSLQNANIPTAFGSLSPTSIVNYARAGNQAIRAANYANLVCSGSGNRSLPNGTIVGVSRSFTPGATTYTITGSTIDFNGSVEQTIPVFNYNNLTSSNTGDRILDNAGSIGISGAFTPGTNSYTADGSTINFRGTNQNIPTFNYNNLAASTSGTKTATGDITIDGNLDIASGVIMNMVTYGLYGSALTTSGTGTLRTQNTNSDPLPEGVNWSMTVTYNSTSPQDIVFGNYTTLTSSNNARTLSNSGTIGISNVFTPGTGTYINDESTIDFNGSGAQTIPSFTYYNLVSSNSGARTLANAGSVRIAGAFTPGTNSYTITGSTVNFNGTTAQVIPVFNYNTLVSSSTGDRTLDNSGAIGVAATFTPGTNIYTINGSTIEFNGTATQTIPAFNYHNLNSSNTGNRTLANAGTIGVAGTFTPGTNTYTITGSTIDYNGSSTQTIKAFSYNRLTSSNSGDRILDNAADINIAGVFTPGTNSYTITGSTINFNGTAAQTIPTFNYHNLSSSSTGGRTLVNGGSVGIAGVFTPGTNTYTITGSTVNFNGSSTQTIPAFRYNNLSSSNSGDRVLDNSSSIRIAGTFSAGTNAYTVTGSTVDFDGAAQSFSAFTFNNLSLSASNTKTATGNITVNGTLTVASGVTMDMSVYPLDGATLVSSGTGSIRTQNTSATPLPSGKDWSTTVLYNSAGAQEIVVGNYQSLNATGGNRTLPNGSTVGIAGTFTPGAGTYTNTGSTINFNGSGAQTIPAFNYNNIISSNTGARTLQGSGTVGIAGTFTPGSNTYTITNSTVNYNGSNPQTIKAFNYFNLTSSSTGTRTLDPGGVVGISRTFTKGTNVYTVTGSTVDFNGNVAQNIPAFTFNNMTASGGRLKTAAGALVVNGVLAMAAGDSLSMGAQLLTGTFTTSGTGVLRTRNTTATPLPVDKTWTMNVDYYSATAQTIVRGNYNGLNGTGANRTLPNGSTVGIAGTFTPGAGTYTITGSTIDFNGASAQTIPAFNYNNLTSSSTGGRTLSGTIGVNGVFTPGTGNAYTVTGSTVDFKSAASQTIPAFNYDNLTSSSTGARVLASSGTIGVASAFTKGTNAYTVTGSTIDFNGASAQTIPVFNYHNLSASNTATKTAAGDLTVGNMLTVGSGSILDMVTNKLTGLTLTTSGSGALHTQRTTSDALPAGKTWSMDVLYNNSSAQTIVEGNYTNLDGTGGDRTLPNGVVTGIAGAFTPGAGTYTSTGSIIDYNGSTNQNVVAFNYHSLKVSGGGTKTMAGNATITDSLKVGSATTLAVDTKSITLKSTPTTTARVGVVEGSITYNTGGGFAVERYYPARRAWRLATSPLTNASTIRSTWQNNGVYEAGKGMLITGPGGNGLDAGNTSMQKFNRTTQLWDAVTATNVSISGNSGNSDNIAYFVFVRGDRSPSNQIVGNSNNTTISSYGQIQTGTQSFDAVTTSGKFTLVGNPYASPIDFNTVSRTNLIKRFYAWDPQLNSLGGYVVLDDLDGDGVFSKSVDGSAQEKEIQSGQAFFVQTMDNGSANLTFDEGNKSSTNITGVFRPMEQTIQSIKSNLYIVNTDGSTIVADGTLTEYNDNYSALVNYQDAVKFGNTNENLSIVRNSANLAVERRPLIIASDTMYLKLAGTTTTKKYRFEFKTANMDPAMEAVLEDKFLGTQTPISIEGSTTVDFTVTSAAASTGANRFRVVFRPAAVLPVTISSIKAYQKNKDIVVDWKVENEINIAGYEVEKSGDGRNFLASKKVTVNGNSSSNQYSWTDESPLTGNNFYRIKSTERNGVSKYSSIVKVVTGKAVNTISVYPNLITNGSINLQLTNQEKGKYQVSLVNSYGQTLVNKTIQHGGGSSTENITLGNNIAKGAYILKVIAPDNSETSIKLVN